MMRKPLSFIIGALLAAPYAVQAQQAPAQGEEAKPNTLDAITVSARKREESLQEVPVAVTAFTADGLDKLNVEDIGDLGAFVPNLTVYAARGSSSTLTAYIRAVGQSDPLWGVDPGVGLYLDDVYVARPQGALLDVFDVERIEVLRGPQGSLYGKNTIGGAIKYVSSALEEDFYGRGSITFGNYSQLDTKASVNLPLGGGWATRLAVASLSRDGYGENIRTGQDVSDKEILAARATLGYLGSPDFSAKFSVDWMDDQSGVRGAKMLGPNTNVVIPVATVPALDSRYDVRNGMPNINDTSMLGASATLSWNLGDAWVLKSVTAYRESDTETNIDFDTLPNTIADVKAFYSDDQLSQEFQLNYDAGGKVRGVAGLYWFTGSAGGQVLNNFYGLSFGDTQGVVDTDSVAVYGEFTWDFAERWALTLGGRYTDEKKTADVYNIGYTDASFTRPSGVVAADFEDSVSFQNFSPKVSLDFKVSEDILLYALASRGFKSGGFNIRAQATAVPRSRLPFDDETVTTFEVGAKNAFLDDRLFVNLAYFNSDYKDIQLSVFTAVPNSNPPVFFGDFTNAGKGSVDGIELEYQALLSPSFTLQGNFAWLDAEYDEFITNNVNVAANQKFTNAPDFSAAITGLHTLQLDGGGSFTTRVSYSYQSEVYPTTDLSEAIKQPGYGLVSAGLIWQTAGAWRFALEGANLADKEYRTTGYNIPALGVLTGFYGAPRTYSLTATYDF
ncbi:TonB-dependent receptor [uncultured Aquimonas sp.]|uniref:TonB-dependent receptor n=1 Tax=uncultured Aquimonas sp. TaxID=385483 RepID=UPI00086B578F|nr:TonB-dependent receptor [uncultured Aquimonas sp.]ODU48419.1 MAG: TonB-dependent receptor [Xanthomonadaceae bacterium SCN 69-123]